VCVRKYLLKFIRIVKSGLSAPVINVGVARYVIVLTSDCRNMPAIRMLQLISHRAFAYISSKDLIKLKCTFFALNKDVKRYVCEALECLRNLWELLHVFRNIVAIPSRLIHASRNGSVIRKWLESDRRKRCTSGREVLTRDSGGIARARPTSGIKSSNAHRRPFPFCKSSSWTCRPGQMPGYQRWK